MPIKEKTVKRLDSIYMQQYEAYIERQTKRRQRLKRRLILFSLVVVVIIGVMSAYHVNQRTIYAEKQEQHEQLENDLATLKKEANNYNEEIALLKNKEYVLELARTNYLFSKKGELIFKVDGKNSSY